MSSRQAVIFLSVVVANMTLVATTAATQKASEEPESSFRLRVRYTVEGVVEEQPGALVQQTEYLSGRVRTGFTTPWGDFVQSGVSQYDSTLRGTSYWRDEVFWRFHVPDSGVTYQVGDLGAGSGLGWVRAYDLTGLQIRRRYGRAAADTVEALTPDPALLRNMDPRAWQWDALPSLPDQATGEVLKKEATEFSVQTGYVRLGRDSPTSHYAPEPVLAGGVRHGLTSELTVESYVEASRRLRNGGAGLAGRFGPFGTIGFAATYSKFEQRRGRQWTAVHQGEFGPVTYFAGTQHRTPGYFDMGRAALHGVAGVSQSPYSRLDTVGLQWPMQHSALRMNYVRLTSPSATPDTTLVNIAYSAALGQQAWWYTSAYADLADDSGFGVYVGIRLPLGRTPDSRRTPAAYSGFLPDSAVRRRASTVMTGTGHISEKDGVRIEASLNRNYTEEQTW